MRILIAGMAAGMAAVAALSLPGASMASEAIVRIAVYDYTAPAFDGSVVFGNKSYTFSDRHARELKSHGDMRIREVLVVVDRDAVLATNGSAWPISICLQVPAAEYRECVPTNQADVLGSATIFGFGPEGWSR